MDKFITRENVAHYTKQLLIEIAPIKREMLQKLLAEEMVKQASQIKPRASTPPQLAASEKGCKRHPDRTAKDHDAQQDREGLVTPSDVIAVVCGLLIGHRPIVAEQHRLSIIAWLT